MLRHHPWDIHKQDRFRTTIEAVDAIVTNNRKRLDDKRFREYTG